MAVAFRSASTKSWTATDPIVLDKPSGTTDGDLLLAAIYIDPRTPTVVSAPSGWTLVTGANIDIGTDAHVFVYWKLASGEGASWSWDMSANSDGAGIVHAISGAHQTTPINTQSATSGSANPLTSSSITPGVNNCMIVVFIGGDCETGGDTDQFQFPSSPNAFTERTDFEGGDTVYAGSGDFIQGTAAAITCSVTFSETDNYGIVAIAVAPATETTHNGAMASDSTSTAAFAGTADHTGIIAADSTTTASFGGTVQGPTVTGAVTSDSVSTAAFAGMADHTGILVADSISTSSIAGTVDHTGQIVSASVSTATINGVAEHTGQLASDSISTASFVGVEDLNGQLAAASTSIALMSGYVAQVVNGEMVSSSLSAAAFAGTVPAAGSINGELLSDMLMTVTFAGTLIDGRAHRVPSRVIRIA